MLPDQVRDLIREIPDFPKPGIMFSDITTVLRDAGAWRLTIDGLCAGVSDLEFDYVVGIESRGFILGATMAYHLDVGFVPIRKAGKLPSSVHSVSYELEYGMDSLEIHQDALAAGDRALIVDDLLATGGTAAAAARLVEECGAEVTAFAFLIELESLAGRQGLTNYPVRAALSY